MKLKELKIRVDYFMKNENNEDLEVYIPNNGYSMGSMSVTKVKGVGPGIDWDRSKFIIWPEVDLIELKH